MGTRNIVCLDPTVQIARRGQTAVHCAQLRLAGGNPGQAKFVAELDGETRVTALTLTGEEQVVLVDIPFRETAETLTYTLTLPDGGRETGEQLWQSQKRWEVHFIPITHHDLGYTEPVEPLLDSYCRYYDRVLAFCDQTADYPAEAQYHYTVEELWSLETYLARTTPENREKFIAYVRQGRIEISALYANVIDSLCDEEELARLLYPAAKLRQEYGIPVDTASLVDMPGMSWGTIRALHEAGIRYLFAGFPKYFEWGDTKQQTPPMEHSFWDEKGLLPKRRPQAFRWQSQTGGEVLTWYQAGYGWFGNDRIPCLETDTYAVVEDNLPGFLKELEERGCPYSVMRYIDHGSDNQMPQGVISDIVRQWNDTYVSPKLVVSTNRGFFHRLEGECEHLPTLCGELPHTDYTMLSLTEAAHTAANNRLHTTLRAVESLGTARGVVTGELTATPAFTDIYRDVLLYDEHCYGMGLPLGTPHAYSWSSKQHYMRRAAYETEKQQKAASAALSAGFDLPEGEYLTVYYPAPRRNTHTLWVWGDGLPENFALEHPKTGENLPVLREDIDSPHLPLEEAATRYAYGVMGGYMGGHSRRFLLTLPPYDGVGYVTYRLVDAEPSVPAAAEGYTLENACLQVVVDPETGKITRLWDKKAGRELADTTADYGFGSLLCHTIEDGTLHTAMQAVRVSRRKTDALAQSILVEGRLEGCPRVVWEITLYGDSTELEIAYRILKDATPFEEVFVAFPFAGAARRFLYRGTAGQVEAFRQQLPGSNTHQHTTQGWAQVETDGGAITITSPDARVVEMGALRPTAVSQAHHGIHPKGFTDPFAPDGGDRAHLFWMLTYNNCQTNFATSQVGDMLYSFHIHTGEPEEGAGPLAFAFKKETAGGTLCAEMQIMQWEPTGAVLTCSKVAEAGGALILRFSNPLDTPQPLHLTLPAGFVRVSACDLCERVQEALPVMEGKLIWTLGGHERLTLRLEKEA